MVGTARNGNFWAKRLEPWCADNKLIISQGEGSKSIAEIIKNLGLERPGTRIGVAKLTGSRFDPEGLVAATFMEHLKANIPDVQFLPIEQWGADAGPVDEVAMVKSSEEHEVIRRAVTAGENAIEVIRRVARPPSKRQADIWFPTFVAMFAETGEDPTRLSIALDVEANATLGAPTDDPLKVGKIINQEIDATVQGYRAQVNHSIFVGERNTPASATATNLRQVTRVGGIATGGREDSIEIPLSLSHDPANLPPTAVTLVQRKRRIRHGELVNHGSGAWFGSVESSDAE